MDVTDRKAPVELPVVSDQGRAERPPGMVEVNVTTPKEVDKSLEEAIAIVSKAAMRHRIGVLVTRTGACSYIVRAHPAVPYGFVRQLHE